MDTNNNTDDLSNMSQNSTFSLLLHQSGVRKVNFNYKPVL